MGRKYYNRFNYVYCPEYVSLFCDNETKIVSQLLGKYFYYEGIIQKHLHPNHGNVAGQERGECGGAHPGSAGQGRVHEGGDVVRLLLVVVVYVKPRGKGRIATTHAQNIHAHPHQLFLQEWHSQHSCH
jgi:hypothetical protein